MVGRGGRSFRSAERRNTGIGGSRGMAEKRKNEQQSAHYPIEWQDSARFRIERPGSNGTDGKI